MKFIVSNIVDVYLSYIMKVLIYYELTCSYLYKEFDLLFN